jgi:type III secretion system YopN/LcrE/InvE/MxiC family regulator
MNERVGGLGSVASLQGSDAPEAAAAARGRLASGIDVIVSKDPISLIKEALEDSLEELSFEAAEKKSEESKDIDDREVSLPEFLMVPEDEAANQDAQELAEGGKGSALKKLLEDIRSANPAIADDALAVVRQSYESPSHQHMALEYLLENLGEDEGDLRSVLEQARDRNLAANGAAVRAGLQNIVDAAHAFAGPDAAKAHSFQDLYRNCVVGRDRPADVYAAILSRFGTGDFPGAVATLLKAAGTDMAFLGKSPDAAKVREVVDDIYQLEALKTVHARWDTVLARLGKRYPELEIKTTTDAMLGLLQMIDRGFPDVAKVDALARSMGVAER